MSKTSIYLHPSITEQSGFAEICNPLQKLNISYFSHVNTNKNNKFSMICNNPKFFEYYIENKYFHSDIHIAKENNLGRYVIWDSLEISGKSEKMKVDAIAFGLNSTFTIIQENTNSRDYYYFSTHLPNKSINQVYMANIDVLEAFINYFKEKTSYYKNISRYLDYKLITTPQEESYQINHDNCSMLEEKEKQELLEYFNVSSQNTNLFKLTLILNKYGLDASNREKEVILGLIQGKSARIIAAELNLSSRTVEHYIENVKLKFNVESKRSLVEKILMLVF